MKEKKNEIKKVIISNLLAYINNYMYIVVSKNIEIKIS